MFMPRVLNGWDSIDWKICSGVAAILKCRAFWKNMFICDVAVQGNFAHCAVLLDVRNCRCFWVSTSWCSSVDIEIGYGLDNRGIVTQVLALERDFSIIQNLTITYSADAGDSVPGAKAAGE
jgi:hypothetical protein